MLEVISRVVKRFSTQTVTMFGPIFVTIVTEITDITMSICLMYNYTDLLQFQVSANMFVLFCLF